MLTGMVAAMVAAQLKMAGLQARAAELDALRETVELQQMRIDELQSREPVYVERVVEVPVERVVEKTVEAAEYRECGQCGAHVTDWWYVASDYDGELIEVCHDCYELHV